MVRWLEREVRRGSPLDVQLAQYFRAHSEYGGRDRRFYSETMFSYFRWRGWLIEQAHCGPDAACALAYLMDAPETLPVVEELARRGGLAGKPLRPLGTVTPQQKSEAVAAWLSAEGNFSLEALVPHWVINELGFPGGGNRSLELGRCLESFQSRPPTWLRVRKQSIRNFCQALATLKLNVNTASKSRPRICPHWSARPGAATRTGKRTIRGTGSCFSGRRRRLRPTIRPTLVGCLCRSRWEDPAACRSGRGSRRDPCK